MTTFTKDQNELFAILDRRIANLTDALETVKNDLIFAWPQFGLGVKIDGDKNFCAIDAHKATTVSRNDQRAFYNGQHQRAIISPRRQVVADSLQRCHASRAWLVEESIRHNAFGPLVHKQVA